MKFLLEKNFGEYDLNKIRAEKEAEEKQAEEETKIKNENNLLGIKEQKEKELGKPYSELKYNEKKSFIEDCLKSMGGSDAIKGINIPLIDAIYKTNWNDDIVNYINNITKSNVGRIKNSVGELTLELIQDGKLNSSAEWLYNKSLYNRYEDDTLYTLKALVFADNKDLQKTASGKDYFSEENPLIVDDLIDEDGTIKDAEEITYIINGKQVATTEIKKGGKSIKQLAKEADRPEEEVSKAVDELKEKIIDDVVSTLIRYGYFDKNQIGRARELAQKHFKENSTAESILSEIIGGEA